MIPSTHTPGTRVIQTQGTAMSVIMDEKSAHTLSSTIYSSHRIPEAVIRELATNAYDSHIKAGKQKTPITIELPSVNSPYLKVTDEGVGLNKEEAEQFLTNYFASGSQYEKNPVGYYGLGAKSPQAYTDTYTVEVVKDGIKNVLLIYKDESGVPCYHFAVEGQTTEQGNGVTYTVPVQEKDFQAFYKAASRVLPYFPVRPEVVAGTYQSSLQNDFKDVSNALKPSIEMDGVGVILIPEDLLPYQLRRHPSLETIMIRMGTVLYPLPVRSLVSDGALEPSCSTALLHKRFASRMYVIFDLDIAKHGMPVNPGREGILSTKENMRKIDKLVRKVESLLSERYEILTRGMTTWEASDFTYRSGGLLQKARKESDISLIAAIILNAKQHFNKNWWEEALSPYGCSATLIKSSYGDMSVKRHAINNKDLNRGLGISPTTVDEVIVQEDSAVTITEVVDRIRDKMRSKDELSKCRKGTKYTLIINAKKKSSEPKKVAEEVIGSRAKIFKKDDHNLSKDVQDSIQGHKAIEAVFSLGECVESRPIPLINTIKASFYKRKDVPAIRLNLSVKEYRRYKKEISVFSRVLGSRIHVVVQDFDKAPFSRIAATDINALYTKDFEGRIRYDLEISKWKTEITSSICAGLKDCGLDPSNELANAGLRFCLSAIRKFTEDFRMLDDNRSYEIVRRLSRESYRIEHVAEFPNIEHGSTTWKSIINKVNKASITEELSEVFRELMSLVVTSPLEMAHVCEVSRERCSNLLTSAKIELDINKKLQHIYEKRGAA